MTSLTMEHIPLRSAYLCQDCDCVGNCATQCPACASAALLSLAVVLNRDERGVAIPMAEFAFAPQMAA